MATKPTTVKIQDVLGFKPGYTDILYTNNSETKVATLKANTEYVYVATVEVAKKGEKATFGATELTEGTYAFTLDTYDNKTSRNVVKTLDGATMWRSLFKDGMSGSEGFIQNSAWLDNTDFLNNAPWDYTGEGWGMTLSNAKVYRFKKTDYDLIVGDKTGLVANTEIVASLAQAVDVTADYKKAATADISDFKTINEGLKANTGLSYTGKANEKLALEYEGSVYTPITSESLSEKVQLVKQADGKLGLTSDQLTAIKADTFTLDGSVVKVGETVIQAIASTGKGNDEIVGSDGVDWINGGAGNDTITAGAGNDFIYGGTEASDAPAGSGADTYVFTLKDGFRNDTLLDADKLDTIKFTDVKAKDLHFVKNGTDLVIEAKRNFETNKVLTDSVTIKGYYKSSDKTEAVDNAVDKIIASGSTISIAKQKLDLTPDSYSARETKDPVYFQEAIIGTAENKTLTATKNVNSYVIGSDADDAISGTSGYNVLIGGAGKDTITAGTGTDEIHAGAGNDEIIATAGTNYIYGEAGDDKITLGKGKDIIGFNLKGNATGFDKDTVANAGVEDVLKFRKNNSSSLVDANKDELTFTRNDNNLVIGDVNDNSSTVTLTDFFKNKSSKNVDTINLGDSNNVSILKDVVITGTLTTDKKYTGTDYNETVAAVAGSELTMGKGKNTINLANDAIDGTKITLTQGETLTLNFTEIDFVTAYNDATDTYTKNGKIRFEQKGTDAILKINTDGDNWKTLTIKDYAGKSTGATVLINGSGHNGMQFYHLFDNLNQGTEAVDTKGKLTGSDMSDRINVADYVSANGVKGVTINSGSGNDDVKGSLFNDTINVKSLAGQSATVTQEGGINKVTFGKGNDVFNATLTGGADGGYSSNNVNMGLGDNTANLTSVGENKLIAGNGSNTVTAKNGVNTIKLGNALTNVTGGAVANTINLNGGLNKVTTGKGVDNFTITNGNNTVNSGAGKDTFNILNGYNTIKTGADDKLFTLISGGTNNITTAKGEDKFTITGGNNIINAGAGKDTFTLTATDNVKDYLTGGAGDDKFIVTSADAALANLNVTLDGGAGNDVYDLSGFAYDKNLIGIIDKKADRKGANTVILKGKENVIFDVALKTDRNGNAVIKKKGDKVTSFTTSNTLIFTADGNLADGVDLTKGVKFETAKNAGLDVKYGTTTNSIDYSKIATVAQNVANWLADESATGGKGYASAFDAFNNCADVGKLGALAACYTSVYNA